VHILTTTYISPVSVKPQSGTLIFLRIAEKSFEYLKERCAYFEDYISTMSAEPQKSLEDHLLHYCFLTGIVHLQWFTPDNESFHILLSVIHRTSDPPLQRIE
jgi:hypothetical protein